MSFDEIEHTDHVQIGTGAAPSEIELAQQKLNVVFPDDYKDFLLKFGRAKLKYDHVHGIGYGVPDLANVVLNTIDERDDFEPLLPNHLIPVMNDGSGNHFCIDINKSRHGISPIVFWDHESRDGQSQIPELISPSFEKWFLETTKTC
ncbi:SMI1/KNR4 family protein [Tundrisphaera lichenicola]|uniref:SMI1/KNR4 family protein n=1 Tax=Tundrisphaera lichenicola TaxID=2029860 RepID=UPI003EB8C1EE